MRRPPFWRRRLGSALRVICCSSQVFAETPDSWAAASTIVYAFMQIPAGYLADRAGPKRLFVLGLAGTNVLAITLALEHDFVLMLLNQAVSGFFPALGGTAEEARVAAGFAREGRLLPDFTRADL